MKRKFLALVIVSMICLNGFTQKIKASEVPQPVKDSFLKYYPGIKPRWEREIDNFEAGFKKDGKIMSALFQPGGAIVEYEMEIEQSELPVASIEYIKDNYKNNPIKESALITNADGTKTYEVAIDSKDLIFDKKGKFLKAVKD